MDFPDLRQVDRAWRQCRRRKRGTPQAQVYETRLLDNLVNTVQALQEESWQPSRPVCFTVAKPKAREIHAAAFCDRVVHHWLVPRLEALYEPVFIHDVYSNRQGKGTHKAVKRLQSFMHRYSLAGEGGGGYFLQLDIANFFVSIDRALLFKLLQRRLKKAVRQGKLPLDEALVLRRVCHVILKQDVGREARILSDFREIASVPAHKRLVNAPSNKGLPIGNLTSQFFANVYMNELDQFIKHDLKCRSYLRYVDDFVLLHADRAQLQQWHGAIEAFLRSRLQLSLRPGAILRPVSHGVDFLGYIIRPHYLLVRRRVVGNLHDKLLTFERRWIRPGKNSHQGRVLSVGVAQLDALLGRLASYLGHFHHADSKRLVASLWRRWLWLGLYFDYRHGRLHALWQPRQVSGYKQQVRFFRSNFPWARVVVQRGCESDAFAPWVESHPNQANTLPAIRQAVRQVNVIEAGYLKGGLKRRVTGIYHIQSGVILCQTSS